MIRAVIEVPIIVIIPASFMAAIFFLLDLQLEASGLSFLCGLLALCAEVWITDTKRLCDEWKCPGRGKYLGDLRGHKYCFDHYVKHKQSAA